MLATACDSGPAQQASVLVADAQRLPVASHSVDLIFANLLLPWCDLAAVFAETARVLAPNGLFMFSSLGPATLQQVRRAWYRIDEAAHVHGFIGPQDVGDLLARAGLYEPVVDVDRIEVTYAAAAALHADLRATGSKNVAGGRRRSLTGARRWRAYEAALEDARRDGRLSITCELIFGQAWAPPVVVTEPKSPAHFKGIPLTMASE